MAEVLVTNFDDLVASMEPTASLSGLVGGALMLVGSYKIDAIVLVEIPENGAKMDTKQYIAGKLVAEIGTKRKAINIMSGSKALPLSSLGQSDRTTIDAKTFASHSIADLKNFVGKFLVIKSRDPQTDQPLPLIAGREDRPRYAVKYVCHLVDTQAEADLKLKA